MKKTKKKQENDPDEDQDGIKRFITTYKQTNFIMKISEQAQDMIDEQKCAQKYLREIQKKTTNTIDARFDNLVER
jgi:hypothetical protein